MNRAGWIWGSGDLGASCSLWRRLAHLLQRAVPEAPARCQATGCQATPRRPPRPPRRREQPGAETSCKVGTMMFYRVTVKNKGGSALFMVQKGSEVAVFFLLIEHCMPLIFRVNSVSVNIQFTDKLQKGSVTSPNFTLA